MEINRFDTATEASAAAGQTLNALLIKHKNSPVLLLLSGGSALSILAYVSASSLGENLTISMLDERFTPLEASTKSAAIADGNLPLTGFSQDTTVNPVRDLSTALDRRQILGRTSPPTSPIAFSNGVNNFLQLQKLDFYAVAVEKNVNFIGTLPRSGEMASDLRARWEIALKNWREANPQGKILATFGLGPDGHTAGIFPYPEDPQFFEQTFKNPHWTVSYKAVGKHKFQDRLTTTFQFFKNIDEAVMLACGAEKQPALERLMTGKAQPYELPALGIYATKHCQIFTDINS